MVQNTTRSKLKAAATAPIGMVLIAMSMVSTVTAIPIVNNLQTALAQPFVQIVEYRDLVIDLGNGVKTNAQLTIPAVGNGPFSRCVARTWLRGYGHE